MSIYYQGLARKVGGVGYIKYVIGVDDDNGLYLQMIDNQDGAGNHEDGTYQQDRIPFSDLILSIADAVEDRHRFDLEKLRGDEELRQPHLLSGNRNNAGFVVAILIDIGLVEEHEDNNYYRFRTRAML